MAQPRTVSRIALLIPLLFLFAAGALHATLLVNENFNYSTGQLTAGGGGANVSGGNWVWFQGAGSYLPVVTGSLSYTGYASSGTGNMVSLVSPAGPAEDAYREFAYQLIGTPVYAAFLLNVTDTLGLAPNGSTTGDYFAELLPVTGTSVLVNRVCIRKGTVVNTYNLGLRASTSNATAIWSAANLSTGVTSLVVLRYRMTAGASNDTASLWINPAVPGTEPAPSLTQVSTAATEPDSIGRFAIRQDVAGAVATPNGSIDGIRAGTTWDDAVGAGIPNPGVTAVTPASNASNVLTHTTISATFDHLIKATTVDTASFAVSGVRQARYYPDSIRPAGNSASFTFYVHDSLRLRDTVTVTLGTAITDTAGNPLLSNYVWKFTTVSPDITPPVVTATDPAAGSPHVLVTSPVIVDFSKPLNPATVDTLTAYIRLEGRLGTYHLRQPVLSNGNKRVTLVPFDSLFYADQVHIHITTGITDTLGNHARDTSIMFATRHDQRPIIYDIQYTTNPSGNSPYVGTNVTVTGVVTAVVRAGNSYGSYTIQDGTGPWNGIYCYDKNRYPALGDSIQVTGPISEYYGLTELGPVSNFVALKKDCALPAPSVLPTSSLTSANPGIEGYEGVLVATNKVMITAAPNSYNEWQFDDGSGSCTAAAFFDSIPHLGFTPTVGDSLVRVEGICIYSFDWRIEPRFAKDVIRFRPVRLSGSLPVSGNTNVPAQILHVRLDFDKQLNPSTVVPANFSITGTRSGPHTFTVSYDSAYKSVQLLPATAYAMSETVSVWVSHALKDTLGFYFDGNGDGTGSNSSADDLQFRFTTMTHRDLLVDVQRPGSDGYTPQMVGQTVLVEGVVTGPDPYFTSSTSSTASWYIQDATGGANVYGGTKGYFDLGRRVVVTGQVTEYNGITEITSDATRITTWDLAQTLPTNLQFIYNQFPTEAEEGKMAQIDGIVSSVPSYAGGGYNMEIRNGEAPIAVRYSETSGFNGALFGLGVKVRVIGITGQYDKYPPYDAGYQILPRFAAPYTYNGVQYPADITVMADTVAPAGSPSIVSYKPNPFCPDLGEFLTIELNAPRTEHLTLRIYDLKGRLIKTLLNSVPGGYHLTRWDGTDDNHRRANIGMYVMHLRSVALDGSTTDKSKVIVLGTPLK